MLPELHARAGGRAASGESVKHFRPLAGIHCPSVVELEWVDSSRGESWELVERCDFKSKSCRSVGWLIYEDRDSIVVASHAVIERGKIAQVFGDMTIPKKAVLSMRTVHMGFLSRRSRRRP